MPASKVDLTDAFASFEEPWQPRLAARVVKTGNAAGSGRTAPARPLDQHPTP